MVVCSAASVWLQVSLLCKLVVDCREVDCRNGCGNDSDTVDQPLYVVSFIRVALSGTGERLCAWSKDRRQL